MGASALYDIGDVVQFTEKHKWCGCFGAIVEIKPCGNDIRYMVGVPIPQSGTAYIFTMESEGDIHYIGRAVLVEAREADEEGEADADD